MPESFEDCSIRGRMHARRNRGRYDYGSHLPMCHPFFRGEQARYYAYLRAYIAEWRSLIGTTPLKAVLRGHVRAEPIIA